MKDKSDVKDIRKILKTLEKDIEAKSKDNIIFPCILLKLLFIIFVIQVLNLLIILQTLVRIGEIKRK